jgi:nucleotide-binding universal stress UspA family protein
MNQTEQVLSENKRITPKTRMQSEFRPTIRKQVEHPIIWAVDPFERDAKHLRTLTSAINLWRQNLDAAVLPVSVISPAEVSWPIEFDAPVSDEILRVADGFLKPIVQKLFKDEGMEPRIILQKKPSHRGAAQRLIDYAKRHKAELIAVSTHGRRGFDRFALGSFAELLLTHSEIPVLTVNSKAEVRTQISTIAFPTDFSAHSKRALKRVIKYAKRLGAKLKLVHVYMIPSEMIPFDINGLAITPSTVRMSWWNAEQHQKKTGEAWAEVARKSGVETEFVFSKRTGDLGEVVTSIADESGADLLIMSEAHNPLSIAFIGGIVRGALANAKVPVLFLPTK